MLVTAEYLRDLGACFEEVEKFKALYPGGLEATYENAQTALEQGFSVIWLLGTTQLVGAPLPISGKLVYGKWAYHYKEGLLHRDGDKPAIVFTTDHYMYYKDGQLHRDGDKPAIAGPDDRFKYYQRGQLHRDGDKPAMIYPQGVEYYQRGLRHRDGNKPALVHKNGLRGYYRDGVLQR